jgi:hypothetical protein
LNTVFFCSIYFSQLNKLSLNWVVQSIGPRHLRSFLGAFLYVALPHPILILTKTLTITLTSVITLTDLTCWFWL